MTHQDTHSIEQPAETEGRLIRWAPYYDFFVNLITLGQAWRLRRMTAELALIQPGDSVLDVGCGTGAVTLMAKTRTGQAGSVHGIDPAPEMIAAARSKAARMGLEINFRAGVIEALPFPDASMDAVTASLMIHHLPDDLKARGLAEIYRVLKPGGRLLVFDLMRPTKSFLNRLFIALTMHHGLKFGIEDLPKMLDEAGFSRAEKLDEKFMVFGFVRAVK